MLGELISPKGGLVSALLLYLNFKGVISLTCERLITQEIAAGKAEVTGVTDKDHE